MTDLNAAALEFWTAETAGRFDEDLVGGAQEFAGGFEDIDRQDDAWLLADDAADLFVFGADGGHDAVAADAARNAAMDLSGLSFAEVI